jgi:hypothetical protein
VIINTCILLYTCNFWHIKDTVLHYHLSDHWRDDLSYHNLQPNVPQAWIKKTNKKSAFSPWHYHWLLFWAFCMLLCSFTLPHHFMQQKSMQMHCSCKPAVRTSWIAFHMHNKHLFTAIQIYGCKLTWMTQQSDTTALCGNICTICCTWCVQKPFNVPHLYKRVKKEGGLKIFLSMFPADQSVNNPHFY